jgi:hypothetical protein
MYISYMYISYICIYLTARHTRGIRVIAAAPAPCFEYAWTGGGGGGGGAAGVCGLFALRAAGGGFVGVSPAAGGRVAADGDGDCMRRVITVMVFWNSHNYDNDNNNSNNDNDDNDDIVIPAAAP